MLGPAYQPVLVSVGLPELRHRPAEMRPGALHLVLCKESGDGEVLPPIGTDIPGDAVLYLQVDRVLPQDVLLQRVNPDEPLGRLDQPQGTAALVGDHQGLGPSPAGTGAEQFKTI